MYMYIYIYTHIYPHVIKGMAGNSLNLVETYQAGRYYSLVPGAASCDASDVWVLGMLQPEDLRSAEKRRVGNQMETTDLRCF